ncbi:hypothetical protein MHYP_G00262590 [Metynnis hypsauchen]
MESLLFLALSVHLASAGSHSLQYVYTAVTPGINFPEFTVVGLVDGEQFVYYDSNIRKMIPKTEWMEKTDADAPGYWNRETQISQGHQETFNVNVATAMQRFNQTTAQRPGEGACATVVCQAPSWWTLIQLRWKIIWKNLHCSCSHSSPLFPVNDGERLRNDLENRTKGAGGSTQF